MPIKLLQASRYLTHSVLLSVNDLAHIIDLLGCQVCNISKVVENFDYKNQLLQVYQNYLEDFNLNQVALPKYRANLSCAFTLDSNCLNTQILSDNRLIIRPTLPIIQVGLFTFAMSSDGKVLSGSLGDSTRSFGLQFSFPAIFRDPLSGKNCNGLKDSINAPAWKLLTKWIRNHSRLLKIKRDHEMIASNLRAANSMDQICHVSF
ncbi:MAG: hypothetical protein P0S95_02420 [Rhabdochlamydiaceae bacterium]|nr:hypothetical protein [Candidatus Amphrikana amoebophyrae]